MSGSKRHPFIPARGMKAVIGAFTDAVPTDMPEDVWPRWVDDMGEVMPLVLALRPEQVARALVLLEAEAQEQLVVFTGQLPTVGAAKDWAVRAIIKAALKRYGDPYGTARILGVSVDGLKELMLKHHVNLPG